MTMLKRIIALACVAGLAACSSLTNGTAWVPPQTQVPLGSIGALTFAVGTATLQDGTTGLNVVAYARQSNGLTPYLVDSPSIGGPSGFTVPVNSATTGNADAGTSSITSTPQTAATNTTFGTSGGLYAGGFGPFNATQHGSNFYPGNPAPYVTPLFDPSTGAGAPTTLLLGEPAITKPFYNVDFPTGFAGYLPGFTAFEAAPAAGTYNLTVNVPASNASSATLSAKANLTSAAPVLAAVAAPAFVKDGKGGGSVTFTAPAGTVESIAFVQDLGAAGCCGSSPPTAYYSVVVKGAGAQSASLPDNVGPCGRTAGGGVILNACTDATSTGPTFVSGEAYSITIVSFDYTDFETTQPGNTEQKPNLGLGASGQADISISPAATGTY